MDNSFGKHAEILNMSGFDFALYEQPHTIATTSEQIAILLYLEDSDSRNLHSMHKFVRLSAYQYRIVLFQMRGMLRIGFQLLGVRQEKAELEQLCKWIMELHDNWSTVDCQRETIQLMGSRIPHNLFHAQKLQQSGELLEDANFSF